MLDFFHLAVADTGLSKDYKHLYEYSTYRCNGKQRCDDIEIPEWWNLIGDTNKRADSNTNPNVTCPESGIKYVSGILYHFSCRGKK